jgi:hypothetical protein
MDRLTTRFSNGTVGLLIDKSVRMRVTYAKALQRLAAYEDTGLEPEEINEIHEAYNEILTRTYGPHKQKMDELLNAEAEGRLIVPPCKVGDTVFEITNLPGDDAIQMRFVAEIAWLSGHGTVLLSSRFVIGFDEFGKTVFRSREEAEAALGGDGDG